jgi:menaquinone-dependent protoporphyrinogen oxidase
MENRVLVAYATKYGATAEIATKIGEVLQAAGLPTDVRPADRVDDLNPYRAVVLGSAVYAGQWRKEAVAFLQKNEQALSGRPVWFFSSGPTGEGDPVELTKGWRFPEGLQAVADRVGPRDTALFHGAIDNEELSLPEKLIIKALKAQTEDSRDWDQITAWAGSIAAALTGESV